MNRSDKFLMNNTTDIVMIINPDGIITEVSSSAERTLHISEQQMVGRDIFEFICDDKMREEIYTTMHDNDDGDTEGYIRSAEGRIYFRMNIQKHQSGWILLLRCLSLYMKAQISHKMLMCNIGDTITRYGGSLWLVDSDGRFAECFGAPEESIHLWQNDAYGKVIGRTINQTMKKKYAEYWMNMLEQCSREKYLRVELHSDNGAVYEVSIIELYMDGSFFYLVILHDISESIRHKQEIQRLNESLEIKIRSRTKELLRMYKNMESFGHTVAHELKSPVSEIMAYTTFLEDDTGTIISEQSRSDLRRIQQICDEMTELINAIMDYCRSVYTDESSVPIYVFPIVSEVFNGISASFPGIEPSLEFCGEDIAVCGFTKMLKVAVSNIIGNSFKFRSKERPLHIKVSCIRKGSMAAFLFEDNGIGFECDMPEKLFGLFASGHSRSEFSGSGVGLATVKSIVERSGGSVRISRGDNYGCIVELELPISKE